MREIDLTGEPPSRGIVDACRIDATRRQEAQFFLRAYALRVARTRSETDDARGA
jgi:hypothetical protein